MENNLTKKEVEDALKELVKAGYLKKTKNGWVDSDRVRAMLKEGKTRKQIAKILDKEVTNANKNNQWNSRANAIK